MLCSPAGPPASEPRLLPSCFAPFPWRTRRRSRGRATRRRPRPEPACLPVCLFSSVTRAPWRQDLFLIPHVSLCSLLLPGIVSPSPIPTRISGRLHGHLLQEVSPTSSVLRACFFLITLMILSAFLLRHVHSDLFTNSAEVSRARVMCAGGLLDTSRASPATRENPRKLEPGGPRGASPHRPSPHPGSDRDPENSGTSLPRKDPAEASCRPTVITTEDPWRADGTNTPKNPPSCRRDRYGFSHRTSEETEADRAAWLASDGAGTWLRGQTPRRGVCGPRRPACPLGPRASRS